MRSAIAPSRPCHKLLSPGKGRIGAMPLRGIAPYVAPNGSSAFVQRSRNAPSQVCTLEAVGDVAGDVLVALAGALDLQPRVVPAGPAVHLGEGDLGVELHTHGRRPAGEGLVGEGAVGTWRGAPRRRPGRSPRGATGRHGPGRPRDDAPPAWSGSGSVSPSRPAPRGRSRPWPPGCRASMGRRGRMPRNGAFSFRATPIHAISRRMNSSLSLALIGPPKITAPQWPASVSGSGSPKRGLRMSLDVAHEPLADVAGVGVLLVQHEQHRLPRPGARHRHLAGGALAAVDFGGLCVKHA